MHWDCQSLKHHSLRSIQEHSSNPRPCAEKKPVDLMQMFWEKRMRSKSMALNPCAGTSVIETFCFLENPRGNSDGHAVDNYCFIHMKVFPGKLLSSESDIEENDAICTGTSAVLGREIPPLLCKDNKLGLLTRICVQCNCSRSFHAISLQILLLYRSFW